MLAIGAGLAVSIDAYRNSRSEAPALLSAALGGLGTFGFITCWGRMNTRISDRQSQDRLIRDAQGREFTVAHAESAGLLAFDLPPEVRRSISAAALPHWFTMYSLPPLRDVAAILLCMFAACAAYWSSRPLQYCFMAILFLLISNGRTRLHQVTADAWLKHGRCPHCTYVLKDIPDIEEGCKRCPECGAIWRTDA
jgi:hypothetical protein